MGSEQLWNIDLIGLLETQLKKESKNIKIKKCRVLRDIFMRFHNNDYFLQLGFFDQDVVIYENCMNIEEFYGVKGIKIHNIDRDMRDQICIPKIILELKYDGINTHTLITYSSIAADIKSIFPNCKYLLVLLHKGSSSHDKLMRNGKNFDGILYFNDGSASKKDYRPGDFERELNKNTEIRKRYNALLGHIKATLAPSSNEFLIKT